MGWCGDQDEDKIFGSTVGMIGSKVRIGAKRKVESLVEGRGRVGVRVGERPSGEDPSGVTTGCGSGATPRPPATWERRQQILRGKTGTKLQ